ncbi:EAL domain-containing protein [Deinococcus sp. Marseille-Q6407]|uniref:EAL domain-containing protein n=1 Tax=Deinococcus sp. Marseille-Q6407 TaxID=2969223 RepID=UPI0021BE17C3|nr:EAL domain-containing protein [Deinococcus sp. Marseille-Q6407]
MPWPRTRRRRCNWPGRPPRAAEQTGTGPLQARALGGLGAITTQTGQYGEALQTQLESLRLVQELRDSEGEVRTLNTIGYLYMHLQDYDQALKYQLEAQAGARAAGHLPLEISATINLAANHDQRGDPETALRLNRGALDRISGLDMGQFAAILHGNIATNLKNMGRFEEGLDACRQTMELAERLNLKESLCDGLMTRGAILRRLGRSAAAAADLQKALNIAEELSATHYLREGYCELSYALEELGDMAGALTALRRYHELKKEQLETISQERTKVLATQLQIDRLEFHAAEQQQRGDQLAAMNETLQAAQAELAYRASHDSLTGLLNRPALEKQLEAICQTRPPEVTAVLFIDLDHFKQINDTLGHPVGDQLLKQVAERLLHNVQPGDEVARQGGDEFTVLLRSVDSPQAAEQAAQQLLEQLAHPYSAGGLTLHTTASIGIAIFPNHGLDVITLQKHADLALYQAKQERGRYRMYQATLGTEALEQLTVEQALHTALQEDGFYLQYQAVVDSGNGQPVMIEALLRWHSPWGEVSPHVFIPVAERSDLILQLGSWAARAALQQLSEWRQLWPQLKISVNVSARQLTQPDLARQVSALLQEYGLDPGALMLELTEAAVVDVRRLRPFQELQAAGLSIGLDDVGTGYASLAGLAQLPMQVLKIDRSLTAQLTPVSAGRSTRPLMHALITFAQESGLDVVAEGVETSEQFDLLRRWGPIQIQGYLESRPLSTEDMTSYLEWKAQEAGLLP